MRDGTIPHGPAMLADERLTVVVNDVALAFAEAGEVTYDLVLLDVDNGPGYLVHDANALLYRAPFLRDVRRVTRQALAIWSAAVAPELESALGEVFDDVRALAYDVQLGERAETYWLYVAPAGELVAVVPGERRVVGVEVDRRQVTTGLGGDEPVEVVVPARPDALRDRGVRHLLGEGQRRDAGGLGEGELPAPETLRVVRRRGAHHQPGGLMALVDEDLLLRHVVALGGHPERDRAARGVTRPRADPALQPLRLGHRGPDVRDGRPEGALEDEVRRPLAVVVPAGRSRR